MKRVGIQKFKSYKNSYFSSIFFSMYYSCPPLIIIKNNGYSMNTLEYLGPAPAVVVYCHELLFSVYYYSSCYSY